jgi:hypothetical protein
MASLRSLGGSRNVFDLVVAGYALGELAAAGTVGYCSPHHQTHLNPHG